jgi:hypothetical protein
MKSFKKKASSMAVEAPGSYAPSISVDSKMIPELSDMSVGDEITLTVKCKLTSINKYRGGDESYSLDVEQGEAETADENQQEARNENEQGD